MFKNTIMIMLAVVGLLLMGACSNDAGSNEEGASAHTGVSVSNATVNTAPSADTGGDRLHNVAVLLDLSDSFEMLDSPEYAATLAREIAPAFEGLYEHSEVSLQSFGAYSTMGQNGFRLTKTINKQYRPPAALREVAALIMQVPGMVENGQIEPQGSTNLVAALTDLSRRIQCDANVSYDVVAITDARERSGSYQTTIPFPEGPIFRGCGTLHIVGLTGNDPAHTEELVRVWNDYARAAGFADIRIIR